MLIPAALFAVSACASNPAPSTLPAGAAPPPLIVLVVVDQLRADLLDRYGDLFTGGFKRLRDGGHSYVNAAHDHAATETAVGHATLSTGVHPNRHGVIANQWYQMSDGKWVLVSSVGDTGVTITGSPGRPGVSPHYLMRTGLADWLISSDRRSRVASVSGKDRGAIHSAAHTHGFVYWFDSQIGRFVTSTYYRRNDPVWISSFNGVELQRHRADTVWDLRVPATALSRADRDTVPSEGDGTHTFFPHRFAAEHGPIPFWSWWAATPNLDAATFELAERIVTSLELGRDGVPDFLNVSVSATDRVGHGYSPLSREQLDNLLRLDRELGDFFDFLDRKVGKDRWTVMLSADHGVLDSPEDLQARGEYGHRLTPSEFATLDSLRAEADRTPDKRAAAIKLVESLRKLPLVADAWTQEELLNGQAADSFAVLQKRSLYPGREDGTFSRQGVEFRFIPGILGGPRGSSHGQTYWYDRHVPMIFMGPGIPAGRDSSRAATVDFAPTAATMLGIPFPKDLDGKVLSAVVAR